MTDSERFDLILAELQGMKTDMQGMKADMQDMKGSIHRLEQRVKTIEVNLENVTNRNIQIIAEGHSDLTRKLNEALKLKEDDEMIRTRLNRLESELEILKKKIG